MQARQSVWTPLAGWAGDREAAPDPAASLVLAFGSVTALRTTSVLDALRARWPNAHVVGCSTAGEIAGVRLLEDSLVATALTFEHTRVHVVEATLAESGGSRGLGERLARALLTEDLAHVLVFSDGLEVNGSGLVEGLTAVLPAGIGVTGGMAADGPRFGETVVVHDGALLRGGAVAVGFVGRRLRAGYGSLGGWDPFGAEWEITKSDGNVLYEIDRRSAIPLYESYLGDHARDLPSSGLLFPLALRRGDDPRPVVRTLLALDRAAGTMTFAGDMPMGARARFMKANFDRLVDGAEGAARISTISLGEEPATVALLISCVGRKLVLQQRVEEELDGVRDVLGASPVLAGFYSYGEIAPWAPGGACTLHNQTMTVTTLREE
jgi:hypothetical protein